VRIRAAAFLVFFGVLCAIPGYSEAPIAIRSVSISRPFFNPGLGQEVRISFDLAHAGRLTLLVVDRDGFPVRRLRDDSPVSAGAMSLSWDGRDDRRAVVPDEAYSFKIDLAGAEGASTYFPANTVAKDFPVTTQYYDRRSAILSYQLPSPARVHIQAGTAKVGPDKKITPGPVLKTIVNREPRPAGAVIENWNGLDEGRATYVPDLPGFAVAIAASALPENAVITTGNRGVSFLEYALRRTGGSLLRLSSTDHAHHHGLSALEDVAPGLRLVPLNATWSASSRSWRSEGSSLRISVSLQGPSSPHFAKQPAELVVHVDDRLVTTLSAPKDGMTFRIPLRSVAPGSHEVAVNWASAFGPVAVGTCRVNTGARAERTSAAEGGNQR